MKSSRPSYLPVAMVCALLVTSFSSHSQEVDPVVQALRQLDQAVAQGQLAQAESQLQALKQKIPGDTRLEQAQRQIAAGYLKQGEQALQQDDLAAAKAALAKTQSLGTAAAAQSSGLANSIEQTQEQSAKQAAQKAAAQQRAAAEAKAAAERAEQARQQRLAAERKAAAAQAQAKVASETKVPAKPEAQLIDPTASSSVVAMPMLDKKDNNQLRALLDQAAADVVAFNCSVLVQVRADKDYPWVFALLSARVKNLDPDFNLVVEQTAVPGQEPQLILTPQT